MTTFWHGIYQSIACCENLGDQYCCLEYGDVYCELFPRSHKFLSSYSLAFTVLL